MSIPIQSRQTQTSIKNFIKTADPRQYVKGRWLQDLKDDFDNLKSSIDNNLTKNSTVDTDKDCFMNSQDDASLLDAVELLEGKTDAFKDDDSDLSMASMDNSFLVEAAEKMENDDQHS